MGRKSIAVFLIVVIVGLLLASCVSAPKYSDYVGYEKQEALSDLRGQKSSNTVKIVLNWLVWGWVGLWIPSVVDTINYFNYLDDFWSIERRIGVFPDGEKVK